MNNGIGRPTRGGRPAVGDQVKIAFPPGLLAQIDEAARQDGTTRSAWVRRACEDKLRGKQ